MVLDSLAGGVPLVTIPLTYEQPAIARRVERVGAGRTLSIRALTAHRLRRTVQDVLERGIYHDSARRMRDAIVEAGGVRRAASVIESLIAR
jgi:zeaxanthin glucosyltransferase